MKTLPATFCMVATLTILHLCCKQPYQIQNPFFTTSNCEELAGTAYTPITPGKIICAARDTSGTLYLVDKLQYALRLFISSGDTLYRKQVLGSGIIGEQYYFLSIQDSMELVFKNSSDIWNDAYLLTGRCTECNSLLSSHIDPRVKSTDYLIAGWSDVCNYLDSVRPNTVRLTIAPSTVIGNYRLQNFPPTTHIEYLAQQQSGQYLLVTRTYYDWNGNVVVHYGLPFQMELGQVDRFLRATDGGSTWITFVVGAKKYEAYFGVKLDTTGLSNRKSWLRIDNDTLVLERKSTDMQALKDIGFDCPVTLR